MCGAPIKLALQTSAADISVTPPQPIYQTVTEVHHHHAPPVQEKPILIEATGKKFKKMYLVAIGFMFMGMTSCMAAVTETDGSKESGAVTMIFWGLGIVFYLRARIGAWWHHG
jgi:hypothetical protein